MLGELSEAADFFVFNRKTQTEEPGNPDRQLAVNILKCPTWEGIPVLRGIARRPFFAGSGELIFLPGYHAPSQTFLSLKSGFSMLPIPEKPTEEQVVYARALLDELFFNFPFVLESDRAHAYAALIYPALSAYIDEPPPALDAEAPVEGAGKGLLVRTILGAGAGNFEPAFFVPERNWEESKKKITAMHLEGCTHAVIDNFAGTFGDLAMLVALTNPMWSDRILGASKFLHIVNRVAWFLTGKNPRFTGEAARRFTRSRIEPDCERPEERTGFKHPQLLDWIKEEQARLYHAILTLIQDWFAKGAHEYEARTLGSFHKWARVIGGVLTTAGIPGFLADRDVFREGSEGDDQNQAWCDFILAMYAQRESRPWRTRDLIPLADAHIAFVFKKTKNEEVADNEKSKETRLGQRLTNKRGQIIAGWKLIKTTIPDDKKRERQAWQLIDPRAEKGFNANGASANGHFDHTADQETL
jgi:hypothetical protein